MKIKEIAEKFLITFALSLALFLAAATNNICLNGSFEANIADPFDWPDDWGDISHVGEIVTDPEHVRSGSQAISINGGDGLYSAATFTLIPGENYTVEFYFKYNTNHIPTNGTYSDPNDYYVRIRYVELQPTTVLHWSGKISNFSHLAPNAFHNDGTGMISNTGDGWFLYTYDFTVSANFEHSGRFDIIPENFGPNENSGEAFVYIDDVIVRQTTGEMTKVADVEFDITNETVNGWTNLTLSCASGGATIRYTADGSEPHIGATIYDAPLFLNYSATIKAKAYHPAYTEGDVTTTTVTVNSSSSDQGVPFTPFDYAEEVDTWWDRHACNPDSGNYVDPDTIVHPANVINVAEFKTNYGANGTAGFEEAFNYGRTNYPQGFTLWVPSNAGPYIFTKTAEATTNYYGWGAPVFLTNVDNVHILSDGAVLRCTNGGMADTFAEAAFFAVGRIETNYDLSGTTRLYHEGAFNNPLKNIMFEGLNFDGGSGGVIETPYHPTAIDFTHSSGILIRKCNFNNFSTAPSHHPGVITTHVKVDHIHIVDCNFHSGFFATYMDGVHGCVLHNNYFGTNFVQGYLLFLPNTDLSEWSAKARMGAFIAITENTVDNSAKTGFRDEFAFINAAAGRIYAENNHVVGPIDRFFYADCSVGRVEDYRIYEYGSCRILSNYITNVNTFSYLRSDSHPARPPINEDYIFSNNTVFLQSGSTSTGQILEIYTKNKEDIPLACPPLSNVLFVDNRFTSDGTANFNAWDTSICMSNVHDIVFKDNVINAADTNDFYTGQLQDFSPVIEYEGDNTVNGDTVPKTISVPDVSPTNGVYPDSFSLTITVDEADAEIYYTTNGKTPTTNDFLYTTTLTESDLDGIFTLKVRSYMSNAEYASPMVIRQYRIGNQLPTADAGDEIYIIDEDGDGEETVTFDGSGSSDIDGSVTNWSWMTNGVEIANGVNGQVTLPVGTHKKVTLQVRDDANKTDTDTVIVNVAASNGRLNLLKNGSFEKPQSGVNPDDWGLVNNQGTAVFTTTNEHAADGTNSLKIELTSGDAAGTIQQNQWIEPVIGGYDYTVQLRAMVTNMSNGMIRFVLHKFEEDGTYLGPAYMSDLVETNSGWVLLSDNLAAETNLYKVRCDLNIETRDGIVAESSKIWLDGAFFGPTPPPIAEAGTNIFMADSGNDGNESVTLDGTGSTNTEGTITNYLWTTNNVVVASGSDSTPTVEFPIGVHTVKLTVTGDNGKKGSDTVTVRIDGNPVAVANAATNFVIVPDSANDGSEIYTLDGSASTDGGGITNYSWTTNNGTDDIVIATDTNTNVSLPGGTNVITLTVTDNAGLQATDILTVVIQAMAEPIADAGTNMTIYDYAADGTESVTLDGSGSSNGDGIITNYSWSTNGIILVSGANDVTNATLSPGTNTLLLTVYDEYGFTDTNAVTVTILTPTAPTADAGGDMTNRDADNDGVASVTLDGSASSAGTGAITNYSWSTNDGSSNIVIATGTNQTVSFPVGTNTVTLTVTNTYGLTDTSAVTVIILPPIMPVANGGGDQSIYDSDTNGSHMAVLDGSASTGGSGAITNWLWTTNNGSTDKKIAEGSNTSAVFPLGSNRVKLKVSCDNGLSDTDTFIVNITDLVPPHADAGANITVTDTDNTKEELITLDASGSSNGDGTITNYAWSTNGHVFASGSNRVTNISFPTGTYTVTLKVHDDNALFNSDNIQVQIEPLIAPTADAGTETVYYVTNSSSSATVVLDASGSSKGTGDITNYMWSTNSHIFASGTNAVTNAGFPVGTNEVTLTVEDEYGLTNTDTVNVIVLTGLPPVADAGTDITVRDTNNSGTESVTLDGSGSTKGTGDITSYTWSTNDGSSNIVIATGTNQTVSFPVGTNTVTLTVINSFGVSDTDTLDVTIEPPIAPTADAGNGTNTWDYRGDGTESVTLDGSGSSNGDAAITTYTWFTTNSGSNVTLVSGPNASTNASLSVGTTTVFLVVTDNNGLRATNSADFVIKTADAPEIVSVSPENNASGIKKDSEIVITFSERMDATSVTTGIKIKDGSATIDGEWSVASNETIFRFTPGSDFAYGAEVTITIPTNAQSQKFVSLTSEVSKTFTVEVSDTLDSITLSTPVLKRGSGQVTVSGLTSETKAKVFTISGSLVNEMTIDKNRGIGSWKLLNSDGNPIAPGVYLLHFSDGSDKEKIMKIVVTP